MSEWGPFFAVHDHSQGAAPVAPWRRFAELLDEPGVLAGRIAAIGEYLGRPAPRVAASVTHLGLVARLISPTLRVAVLTGSFPVLDLGEVWWQPELGGTFPLAAHFAPGGSAAALTDGPLRTLTAAFDVPDTVLRGNVASAINGSATMIATIRPDLADRAGELAAELLATRLLRGTSTHRADGSFQRRSCCLIYQAASPPDTSAVCGDCVLAG